MQLLNKGEAKRIIAEAKLNEKSSRSHNILCKFRIFMKDKNNEEKKYNPQLNLVDPVGSEKVSKVNARECVLKKEEYK